MKEVLKLALEALEGVLDNSPKVLDASISGGLYEVVQCRDAITAIKEALAQPEQEPTTGNILMDSYKAMQAKKLTAQPEQEPVAWLTEERYAQLHTAQRTWVGLTDEEVGDLSDFAYANDEEFVRNVEKYLKEKNNG